MRENMAMKTIRDIPNLNDVKVLVRADFNVPVRNGRVVDDFRIKAALPTIDFLRKGGATIVLMSHLEAVDGTNPTLAPVASTLGNLGISVTFIQNYRQAYEKIEVEQGGIFLLENLRSFAGEKENDQTFARELATLGDIYVNDAFSVSHREHASIVSVPKLMPSYAGLQLESEVAHLSKAFKPAHPFVFALGGAKFDTKLPLINRFLGEADTVFIGGALANDGFKARGFEVGISKVSNGHADITTVVANPKVALPVDVVVQDHIEKELDQVAPADKILDAGPKTCELLREKIADAKFILWNGPLGLYEDGYQGATLELAKMIGKATSRGAETMVGGGDTLAAIATLGIQDQFSFISTGGGAMLDFLAQGTLPGIEALEK